MAIELFDSLTRTDLNLTEDYYRFGNLFVEGDISDAAPSITRGSRTCEEEPDSTLEIFGDLFVTGSICLYSLIVHGNLYCSGLNCTTCNVDGDIFIDKDADAKYISARGNINIQGSAYIYDFMESYGSIFIKKTADATELRAFDKIEVGAYIINAERLTAGDGILCKEEIWPTTSDPEIPFKISVLQGGVTSSNINIG